MSDKENAPEPIDNNKLIADFEFETTDPAAEPNGSDNNDDDSADDNDGTDDDSTDTGDVDDTDDDSDDGGDSGGDDSGEGGDDADDSDDDSADDKEKRKGKKKTVAERIAEITKKRREAERAAQEADQEKTALAEENRKLKEKLGLTDDKSDAKSDNDDGKPVAPDPSKFEYGEYDPKFREAEREFLRQSTLAELRAEQEQQRQSDAAEQEATSKAQERKELLDTQIESGVTKYEDYEKVVLEGELNNLPPPSDEAADLILRSEHGADLMYYFAQNPDEVRSMVEKPPIQQAAYIGRLEAKFSSEAKPKNEDTQKGKKKVSKAPAPISRARGGDGKFSIADDTDDFAAFEKKHAKTQ